MSSYLPFLTGNQAQQSWSWTHDVTLLAASLNDVSSGRSGSGIFTGIRGHLSGRTSPSLRYMTTLTPTTQIITSTIHPIYHRGRESEDQDGFSVLKNTWRDTRRRRPPSILQTGQPWDVEQVMKDRGILKLGKSSLKGYTTQLITGDKNCVEDNYGSQTYYRCPVSQQVCNSGICCQFNLTVDYFTCGDGCYADALVPTPDNFFLFRYRMAVLDGVTKPWKNGGSLGVQICSVVSCLGSDIDSCGEMPGPSSYKMNVMTFQGVTNRIWATSISRVAITGNFTTNSSTLLSPTLLLGQTDSAEPNRFGLISNRFALDKMTTLLLPDQTRNLGTVALINRIFTRDGEPSASHLHKFSISLYLLLFLINYIHYHNV